ncbi:MAG: signal peptidase I [Thermoleophilum sp.]|nr:signal peptidase I [Thermoleophilum sp.]
MSSPAAGAKRGRSRLAGFVELIVVVGLALGLAFLIQAFLVKPFRIPSESMEPTLDVGQRVLVERVTYRFSDPHRGDIVVFKPPRGADPDVSSCGVPHPEDSPCPRPTPRHSSTNYIKRVVGLPGERLKVIGGHVYINGRRLREPWARIDPGCASTCTLPREITIPRGYYFMMGDNRGASADSREWGPVPKRWMIGKAFFTYWPPNRVGTF